MMRRLLILADHSGRLLENLLLAVLLLGMIGLGTAQIVLREFNLGTLASADEAIRLMVLWIAMIAGIAAAREDRHITIDVLSRFLAPRLRAAMAVLVHLFTAIVCLALAWYGGLMVQLAAEGGDRLLGGLPAWPFQAVIPVAFLLMGWRYLIWAARRLHGLFLRTAGAN